MRKKGIILTDDQIESLLIGAKPDQQIPAEADLRIRNMIKANTADFIPAKGTTHTFVPAKRFALPAAAVFLVGLGLTLFFMTDLFRDSDQRLAWGKILSEEGSVTSLTNGSASGMQFGSAITGKSSLITGPASSCLVQLKDGSKLFLGENSEISFSRLTKGSRFTARIVLNKGIVSAKVHKLSKGSEFSIRAGLLKAEVRGTEFMVNTVSGEPYVAVLEGAVRVSRSDSRTSRTAYSMEKAYLSKNGIEKSAISEADGTTIMKARGYDDAVSPEDITGIYRSDTKSSADVKLTAYAAATRNENSTLSWVLNVDAAREWVDSRIDVKNGDIVEISAEGSVTTEKGGKGVGPNGEDTENARERISRTAPFGSLVMSPDGGKNIIYVGGSDKFRATTSGRLLFSVNDQKGSFGDNGGEFTLKVTVKRTK